MKKKEKSAENGLLAAAGRAIGMRAAALADGVRLVREETPGNLKRRLYYVFLALGVFAASLIISAGSYPLSVHPAGIALICAAGTGGLTTAREHRKINSDGIILVCASLGAIIAAIGYGDVSLFYIFAVIVLSVARIVLTAGKLDENLIMRITMAAVSALFVGFCCAVKNGLDTMSILAAITLVLTTPMLSYMYNGLYIYRNAGETSSGVLGRRAVYLEAALGAVLFSILYSVRTVGIFGFGLTSVLAGIITFSVSRMRGPLYGAVCGLCCGLAGGTASMATVLGIAGFFSGLFFAYSTVTALMISFVAATGYLLYTDGGSFTRMGDLLASAVLFFPIAGLLPADRQVSVMPQSRSFGNERATEKLTSLADAFCSLSEVFYTVSDKSKKPRISEAGRIVGSVCDGVCADCRDSANCWGREYSSTSDVTMKLASHLVNAGSITAQDVSPHFRSKCKRLDRLISEINSAYESYCSEKLAGDGTAVLAGQYNSVSRLLRTTAGEFSRSLARDPVAEKKALKTLSSLGIDAVRVFACGERGAVIDCIGVDPTKIKASADEITEAFERRFGHLFEEPKFVSMGGSVSMQLCPKRRYTLRCSKACLAKNGESVSGDSAAFFESDNGSFFALVCDGMGSGRDAALTSRLAVIFIEKLMLSSGPKSVTLEMLNSFLLSRGGETFTTVDMLEIDLIGGKSNFIKAGAAPSFVLRAGAIYKISSNTPPAGIIDRMTAEQTNMELIHGDTVIMLSDGIASSAEGAVWLLELLENAEDCSAAELAEKILREAKKRNSGSSIDDMTVMVLQISDIKAQKTA